jgi:hypothetical protein
MSETEAVKNADQFAENVIAGRSRGNMPTIFDAKNPVTKIFTAFQLEVANQYGYMFKDAPTDAKNKTRLIKGYAAAFLGAYAYNALYSSLVGRDAALDPISILEDLFKDLMDDDEEKEPGEAFTNLMGNVLDEVPFVGGLMGGGRIPISSALPYGGDFESFVSDTANGEVNTKEWLKPIYYLAFPFGGGQVKKFNEGLGMFSDKHPVSGSYTASGKLRFAVDDTLANKVQAAMFGQYASKNAREYFDEGYAPLGKNQIQELVDADIPYKDYREYREGLDDIAPLPGNESVTLSQQADYINSLDIPTSKKNILINNLTDRKTPIDMTDYDLYRNFEEFDFASKNPGEYKVAKLVGGYDNYTTYKDVIGEIDGKDENGNSVNGLKKERVRAYIGGLNISAGQKAVLFRSYYPKDDSYNQDVVDYIVSRSDLTYEDRVALLTELGFIVTADGQIYSK